MDAFAKVAFSSSWGEECLKDFVLQVAHLKSLLLQLLVCERTTIEHPAAGQSPEM